MIEIKGVCKVASFAEAELPPQSLLYREAKQACEAILRLRHACYGFSDESEGASP
jgi:hypothetical protein